MKDKDSIFKKLEQDFEIEGRLHVGPNGLVNVDGSLFYKGGETKNLGLEFGVIRGHACFANARIGNLTELPKPDYACLLTIPYHDKLPLLKLLMRKRSDGVFCFGQPDKKWTKNMRLALNIIREYQQKILASELKLKAAILKAQKELIDAGLVENARW